MTPVASVAFKKRWIDRLVWALMLNTTTVYSMYSITLDGEDQT